MLRATGPKATPNGKLAKLSTASGDGSKTPKAGLARPLFTFRGDGSKTPNPADLVMGSPATKTGKAAGCRNDAEEMFSVVRPSRRPVIVN